MKILHYTLGFPPYRTGGMTKYCIDTALTQKENGHKVGILWPGEINPLLKQKIRKRKNWNGIENYEIVNPLPVALDEGIIETEKYMEAGDAAIYSQFLDEFQPDVIHIHTLMGLYKELLDEAEKKGIKTIFTTHDYYGICPKVTLFHHGENCTDDDCKECALCNKTAMSLKKIMILQSLPYRICKDTKIVKKMRQIHRKKFFNAELNEKNSVPAYYTNPCQVEKYKKLRQFYLDMLNSVSMIHFNSSVAEEVYGHYIKHQNTFTMPITHRNILDKRVIRAYNAGILKIVYLGPQKAFKGFQTLLDAMDELWNSGEHGFILKIYNGVDINKPYAVYKSSSYSYDQLPEIFDDADLLVAPSVWHETFGFTVLEALSFGVPVVVSENVGAKDLFVGPMKKMIIKPQKDALIEIVEELILDRTKLVDCNNCICKDLSLPSINDYMGLYKRVIKC